jgi:hypothetical protein
MLHCCSFRETRHVFLTRSIPYFIPFFIYVYLLQIRNQCCKLKSPVDTSNFLFYFLKYTPYRHTFRTELADAHCSLRTVTQRDLIDGYQHFGFTLKMETIRSSETSVSTCKAIRGHNLSDRTRHILSLCENFKCKQLKILTRFTFSVYRNVLQTTGEPTPGRVFEPSTSRTQSRSAAAQLTCCWFASIDFTRLRHTLLPEFNCVAS